MAYCESCNNFNEVDMCEKCNKGSNFKRITNADRIRSMSDEELAEFLSSINTGRDIGYDYFLAKGGICIESNKNLIKKLQDWLQSERWE